LGGGDDSQLGIDELPQMARFEAGSSRDTTNLTQLDLRTAQGLFCWLDSDWICTFGLRLPHVSGDLIRTRIFFNNKNENGD